MNFAVAYAQIENAGTFTIEPACDYLQSAWSGALLKPQRYDHTLFPVEFPMLDFKCVNNGSRTLFLTEIRLKVASSIPDPRPILIVKEVRSPAQFLIVNDGWGAARHGRFHFNLHAG